MNITAPNKLTSDCFKDFSYRDLDLDKWLPEVQPAFSRDVSILTPPKEMTFLDMAQHLLGTQDPEEIKKHCLTLPMVEELIKTADTNGMKTDGYANFFFVENKDGGVSVAHVRRYDFDRRWNAYVFELARSIRWRADDRLVVCNLDYKTLGNSDTKDGFEARLEAVESKVDAILGMFKTIDL